MSVTLCHLTAFRCLRRWDYLPHAPNASLCPEADLAYAHGPGFLDRLEPDAARALLRLDDPLSSPENNGTDRSLFAQPLDVMCAAGGPRSRSDLVCAHCWAPPVTPGMLRTLQEGLCVCGPELCYVQLARELSCAQLALAGCALLSTYAPCPSSTFGIVEAASQASIEGLTQVAEQLKGMRGATQARGGTRLLLAGAASPMETRVALYLSLPKRLGGHGLPKPVLNQRYDVSGRLQQVADRSHYRTDLCWPDARLALEYDSDAAHTGPDRIARDTRRRNALASMGITVLGVTRQQAQSRPELDRVARIVAGRLGITVRERRRDQEERREALYRSLFKQNWHLV